MFFFTKFHSTMPRFYMQNKQMRLNGNTGQKMIQHTIPSTLNRELELLTVTIVLLLLAIGAG